jgi:hypothetical protein
MAYLDTTLVRKQTSNLEKYKKMMKKNCRIKQFLRVHKIVEFGRIFGIV